MWYDNGDMSRCTVTKCMSASEESLLEAQLQASGAKICYTQHRLPPSVISSTTSSSASVASCGGSTAALINKHNKNKKHQFKVNIHKHKIYNKGGKMSNQSRKELNLLITNPTLLVGLDTDECKEKRDNQSTTITVPYSEMERDTDDVDSKRLSLIENSQYDLENEKNAHFINHSTIRPDFGDSNLRHSQKLTLSAVLPQVLAAISVSLGSMVVGFSSAYSSPATASMKSNQTTIHITNTEESWIGSLMPLCALVGGVIGGPLIDTIGRKTTILSTAVPFILSFIMIALASNVQMILGGRSIQGLCVGVASLALPVYLGETVQPEVRGTLGLLPTTLGNTGILICFIAGKYLDWSMLAMLGAAIPVPFLLSMFLIPETPRWYIEKNKHKKAKKSLRWLRGKTTDITHEFSELEKSNQDVEESEFPIKEFFSAKYRRPLLIALGLMFFQQMSGINAVIFYTVKIFRDAGSSVDENLSTIIVGIVNMGSTFIATMLIDRLGRKILLYASSILMMITLTTLGIFFYFKNLMTVEQQHQLTQQIGWLPLVSFVVFVIGFSIGFGPIPWLMLGEILPAKIRGSAAALATAFNWACTFIVTKTFNDLQLFLGQHGAFWMFAAICFAGLGFVIMSVPETQGKSLEDIERNLTGGGDKIPVRTERRRSSIANLKPTPMAL